jgi:putative hydrolase of the HAD superfamily
VPLLLLDLDNTLVDRSSAFRRWAVCFAAGVGGGAAAVDWLVAADRDGLEPRDRLAELVSRRFALDGARRAGLVAELRAGTVEYIEAGPAVPAALDRACAAGWVPVVVSNGAVAQQEAKLRRVGLDRHLAGWVISEGAGISKPDPRIFRLAAAQAGQDLTGAWMIGDSPLADIGGAHAAGIASVWLHRGRSWPDLPFTPDRIAGTCAAAIVAILDAGVPRRAGLSNRGFRRGRGTGIRARPGRSASCWPRAGRGS